MADRGYAGEMNTNTWGDDFTALSFLVDQMAARHSHVAWVKVMAVTGGGLGAVGTVDVQPMVNQLTGGGQPMAHGTIYSLKYIRLFGGSSAVVIDPVVGDIGIAFFADRDSSAVKETGAVANPGSRRRFDMADGIYMGGIPYGAPTQYVVVSPAGINIVSTVAVTIDAPSVMINGKEFLTHEHSGVQTGGGNTGGVV